MTKIETGHLDVPRDFQIACEAFGIMVPDFLQLIVRRFAFIHLFTHDNSEYDMATKAFAYAENLLIDQPELKTNYSLVKQAHEATSCLQRLMKLAMNKSYSALMKRDKATKITGKLYAMTAREIKFNPHVYYNEDTKITLGKDFLLMTVVHQYPPIVLLNALMRYVSLADLYARMHLGKEEHNPALAFYLRVQSGYGKLVDQTHINTMGFKNFILDLQEFKTRYFLFHRLDERMEVYRKRLEENFQQMNIALDDNDE